MALGLHPATWICARDMQMRMRMRIYAAAVAGTQKEGRGGTVVMALFASKKMAVPGTAVLVGPGAG